MKRIIISLLTAAAILLISSCNLFSGFALDKVYVSTHGEDNTLMNGGSPEKPLRTLGAASGIVSDGGQIYVSYGTYEECHVYIKGTSFHLLGGYNKAFTERDINLYETILDGTNQKDGYSVIAANADALIEGFTIQNGADGGILVGADVENITVNILDCVIKNNNSQYGGGMRIENGAEAIITDCTFSGNSGDNTGGILCWGANSTATIKNCTITGNTGTSVGGLHCTGGGTASIQNSVITNNTPGNVSGSYTDLGGNSIGS